MMQREERERVVITGLGIVSSLACGALPTFNALLEGRSGVVPLAAPLDTLPVHIGAPAAFADASSALGAKEAKRHARFTQLAVVAAEEAVRDAGLRDAGYDPEQMAVLLGVGMGGVEIFAQQVRVLDQAGPTRVWPFTIPALIPNMAAGVIAQWLGAQGPCFCISSACASSTHALGEAMHKLRAGVIDVALAGGSEAVITAPTLAAFERMGALSRRNDEPTRACRPFDRDRDGFVLGEGAGMLVLERLDRARARGAKIYAEIAGYGASADAYHATQPPESGRGAQLSMRAALRDARVTADKVGYVNAHGTGTRFNDTVESTALSAVFGEHARKLWISSTKSMMGHLLGGAGAVEAAITALVLSRAAVPPTINLDHPDPACGLDYVPLHARERQFAAALSNSFGFGGQNASLLLTCAQS